MHYERTGNKLVFHISRSGAVVKCFIIAMVLLGFPWILLGMPLDIQELKAMEKGLVQHTGLNTGFFIIACLPLFLVPSLIKNLRVALVGRTITFDGTAHKIFINSRALVHFSEIENFNFQSMKPNAFLTSGKFVFQLSARRILFDNPAFSL